MRFIVVSWPAVSTSTMVASGLCDARVLHLRRHLGAVVHAAACTWPMDAPAMEYTRSRRRCSVACKGGAS
jgi:hypothetical protein